VFSSLSIVCHVRMPLKITAWKMPLWCRKVVTALIGAPNRRIISQSLPSDEISSLFSAIYEYSGYFVLDSGVFTRSSRPQVVECLLLL